MGKLMFLYARQSLWACIGMLLCLATVLADDAVPARGMDWPDNFVTRVEALALLQTLNADLLSHDSATGTLEHWCGAHRLASPPHIVADRLPGTDKPPTPEQRRDLKVTPADAIRYRHVRLRCGTVVLSEADNWYVPGRLTPEMNRLLETTEIPFGKVVSELHFQRHTLSATLLWLPLSANWEMNPAAAIGRAALLQIPPKLLEHRALLTLPDGTPFSEVVETYTENVLAFPLPKRRGAL
jgi:hypothetical protein